MSIYANRWGGPRYRTEELAKFLHKHLYNIQEDQLIEGKKVNTILAHDALLSSRHTPLYACSIKKADCTAVVFIRDELGFDGFFSEGTEILIHRGDKIQFEKIENVKVGDRRVINFEKVDTFKNDKLKHHRSFSENFLTIKCEDSYETKMILCDALSSMTLLKKEDKNVVRRIDQFNSKNIQEIHLIDITDVMTGLIPFEISFKIEFLPFSYRLKKNKELSDKSENRYYKYRSRTQDKRFMEKMRSKVFRIKKSKVDFKMELKHVED
jgi:hypothetical protein